MTAEQYWENPFTGRAETPPESMRFSPLEWANARPYHLADEISRGEEHVTALRESRDKIVAAGESTGVVYQAKLDETDRMVTAAADFVRQLRDQAEAEFPDGRVDKLIGSSPGRRQGLASLGNFAYAKVALVEAGS